MDLFTELGKLLNPSLIIKPMTKSDVVCSCYMCGKAIEQPEEQFDMYGEIVCKDCWDYNMYQALQDGGGM